MNLIKTGDFCTIVGKGLSKFGLKQDNLVFVLAEGLLPRGDDPYDKRVSFMVVKTKEQDVDLENGEKFYVDPAQLRKVKPRAQAKLLKKLEAKHGA